MRANSLRPLGLAPALLAGLSLSAPVLAQSGDGPLGAITSAQGPIVEISDLCSRILVSIEAVAGRAEALEWAPEITFDREEAFYSEVLGSKEFVGLGTGELTALTEYYPSRIIGFCKVEIEDPESELGIEALNDLGPLSGPTNDFGDEVFISLEEPGGDPRYFLQAYRQSDFAAVQFTVFQAPGTKSK